MPASKTSIVCSTYCRSILPLVVLACVATASKLSADNWPQWRGPNGDGRANAGSYATHWSKDKNIVWSVDLPGRGASTPIVWENNIFLTYGANERNFIMCLDRTGKTKWSVDVSAEKAGKHKKATGSNPSCTTDGKLVYAYFKSGDLVAVSFDGNKVWQKNLQSEFGEDTLWWDLGTSPVLTSNAVVVACMHSGPSYLAAFNKADGKLLWKAERDLDAPSEAAQSYSTPIVQGPAGNETIYTLGADHVTAHSAKDGKEIWRVGGLNPGGEKFFRSIASPVVDGNVLVAPYARGSTITAIKLGGKGDVTKSHVVWSKGQGDKLGSDVPTPAADHGKVYICTDKGEIACLNSESGSQIWRDKLPANRNAYSSSPVIAGGHIYVTREDGVTFVLKQGDRFEVVSENSLDGFVVATPVFVDGQILIRSDNKLYGIAGN